MPRKRLQVTSRNYRSWHTSTKGSVISRRRLDAELVTRGLATSREHASALIADRKVTVNGAPALKAARQVSSAEAIVVSGPPPRFVSRAGEKLAKALELFDIDPDGLNCLDAGSSTGGFSDCLLQAGANSVLAVDVGTGQLHQRVREHPKIDVLEQTDIRSITLGDFADDPRRESGFDLVVADLSFISTTALLDTLSPLVAPGGAAIVLIKPQFEAGRQEVSKGRGFITDPEIWTRVLHEFVDAATAAGLPIQDLAISPLRGSKGKGSGGSASRRGGGNVEFLGLARRADILEQ